MPAAHDRGGWPDETPIDRDEHLYSDWERRVDAVHQALGAQGIRTTDEMRRAIESLPPERYEALSYYEKWTAALEILLIEKGILTADEIDAKTAVLREQGL
jgi:nitrile hydratase